MKPLRDTHTPQKPTDHALILALRNGEEWAFTTLVDQYFSGMLRFSMTVAPDISIAETLVKDVWQEVLIRLAEYDGRPSIRVWIFRLLHIHVRQLPNVSSTRSDMRGRENRGIQLPKCFPSDQHQQAGALHKLLNHAASPLTPRQRQVITLRDMEQFDAHEICAILDISKRTYLTELRWARLAAHERIAHQSAFFPPPIVTSF